VGFLGIIEHTSWLWDFCLLYLLSLVFSIHQTNWVICYFGTEIPSAHLYLRTTWSCFWPCSWTTPRPGTKTSWKANKRQSSTSLLWAPLTHSKTGWPQTDDPLPLAVKCWDYKHVLPPSAFEAISKMEIGLFRVCIDSCVNSGHLCLSKDLCIS
jgi:hypothetical protein